MDYRYDLTDDDGEVRELTAEDFARFVPFRDLPLAEQFRFQSPVRVHPEGLHPYWCVKETGLRYADENTPAENMIVNGEQILSFHEMPEAYQAIARGEKPYPSVARQSVELLPEVVEPFRARGEGWERVMEGALREWLRDHAA